MLQLRHVLFGGRVLREAPGQHEFGFEHRPTGIDQAIQRRRHPFVDRVGQAPLYAPNGVAGAALIPLPIEVLGDHAELDQEVTGEVLGLDLATLLLPQPHQGGLVCRP